jgi:acyl-CoA synthetase (AMP-forming)/AMP-acid ligase II
MGDIANVVRPTIVADILAFAVRQLASYKVPEGLAVVDDFPRNALSKVDRKALTVMAEEVNPLRFAGASLQPEQPDKQLAR